jgi:hypothetical protein
MSVDPSPPTGDPLPPGTRIKIRYIVEVEGRPVFNEVYDADRLDRELKTAPEAVKELWLRQVQAPVVCRQARGFPAALTQYTEDGTQPPGS